MICHTCSSLVLVSVLTHASRQIGPIIITSINIKFLLIQLSLLLIWSHSIAQRIKTANVVEYNNNLFSSSVKARCTPEKLTMLTKHCKTLFFNHVVKNIVNYQLQKLYIKRTSIKGLNYAFATWCHSALKYL